MESREKLWPVIYMNSIYLGIDLAKDKYDYCIMDEDLNIVTAKKECNNDLPSFEELYETISSIGLKKKLHIGMESTGIYHLPLYNYMIEKGLKVRIFNGLEVSGMKKLGKVPTVHREFTPLEIEPSTLAFVEYLKSIPYVRASLVDELGSLTALA